MTGRPVDLVVVGGGTTGLAAAWEASGRGATVAVVDPGPLGGKVRASGFDGGILDEGADAFLARVPEGVELCRELGLGGDLVAPAARRALVWSRGALRPLPGSHLMGVPTDLDELAATGIVSAEGVERARADLTRPFPPPGDDDLTVGALIRERLGDEVLERLVDPLVGGINAGDSDRLSLRATVPQLDAAARSGHPSLVAGAEALRKAATADPAAPVFFAPRGGMGALVERLVAGLAGRGVTFLAAPVEGLARDGTGWSLATGAGPVGAARVVVTTPAAPAAALLRPVAPRAATLLAAVPYASVAMVALSVPRAGIDRELDGSGFLVPRVEGRLVTACSWTSSKWAHLARDDRAWLRASVGRDGDERGLDLPDGPLVDAVLADLADLMGLRDSPTWARVTRWVGSLPQYRPGHLDRVDAVEADLRAAAPGLAWTGAGARGLGVPACIRQGRTTAAVLLAG
ncbi:MAG: protoporphyrinogen oxidase [Acidimicrobiia bacterium]